MKRLMVLALVAVLVIGLAVPAFAGGRHHRHRHATSDIALGLASFAVASQLIWTLAQPRPMVYEQTIYVTPSYMVYPPAPQVLYMPQPQVMVVPPTPSVVYYPHGRYELRWYGTYYQWVWIPNY